MHHTVDVIEDEEELTSYQPSEDPISAGVGAVGYLHRHTLDECVERFDGGIARFPEMFDRFYFDTPSGPVLIDVLADGSPEQLEEERGRKRVAFKTAWCAENDRRYLPLPESDIAPEKIRMLLSDAPEPAVSKPAGQRTQTAKRGAIQRPKATA